MPIIYSRYNTTCVHKCYKKLLTLHNRPSQDLVCWCAVVCDGDFFSKTPFHTKTLFSVATYTSERHLRRCHFIFPPQTYSVRTCPSSAGTTSGTVGAFWRSLLRNRHLTGARVRPSRPRVGRVSKSSRLRRKRTPLPTPTPPPLPASGSGTRARMPRPRERGRRAVLCETRAGVTRRGGSFARGFK